MSRIEGEGGGGGESEKEEVNNKEELETTDHLFCMFCKQILKSSSISSSSLSFTATKVFLSFHLNGHYKRKKD